MSDRLDWDRIDTLKYQDEAEACRALLARAPLSPEERRSVEREAADMVRAARKSAEKQGVVESFLQQFSLGTREGLALMCLAEALLRTPDAETRDRLIAEKIGSADWASHLGQSDSLFVNASTWGLMLTGKLIDVDEDAKTDLGGWLKRLTARVGEPVIRQAVGAAVKMMGEQFVLGRTVEAALQRAKKEGYTCSFDMRSVMRRSMRMRSRQSAAPAPRAPRPRMGMACRSNSPLSARVMKRCRKSASGTSCIPV